MNKAEIEEWIKERRVYGENGAIAALIAEVIELRKRVTELEQQNASPTWSERFRNYVSMVAPTVEPRA
ncbi:MAG TPA: hypothetical protein VK025_07865 [Steroidobacter sp.]|nr:hypothetical protein [Steroidobacter sp.]